MTSRDAEKLELERATELLGRSTRPGRLLEFLGAKYFAQQEAQLTEFDIAREVFGRSLQNFDPDADAVVRVETHRLRKKLRDIYEKDSRPQTAKVCGGFAHGPGGSPPSRSCLSLSWACG